MKYVVVTGVSTGIGYATCEALLKRGYHVFGSVRREADGCRLSDAFGAEFTPLLFDVTDQEALQRGVSAVAEIIGDQGLSGLVNNAGVAVHGPLMHVPAQSLRDQLEVNVIATVSTTQAFLPLLGASRTATAPRGRIVNISSTSGRMVSPFLGPYAASKHALEALSEAFRYELMLYGIKVVVVAPGNISTPIWDKTQEEPVYLDSDYGPMYRKLLTRASQVKETAVSADVVADIICTALEAKHPKWRYQTDTLKKRSARWVSRRIVTPIKYRIHESRCSNESHA